MEVIGGEHCRAFHQFRWVTSHISSLYYCTYLIVAILNTRKMCVRSFLTLRKQHHRVVLLLEMISKGNEHLPCFAGDAQRVIEDMRLRFFPDVHDIAAAEEVQRLIDASLDNWTTTCYDRYQRYFVGVF